MELEAYTILPSLCNAGHQTQSFICAYQTLYPEERPQPPTLIFHHILGIGLISLVLYNPFFTLQ